MNAQEMHLALVAHIYQATMARWRAPTEREAAFVSARRYLTSRRKPQAVIVPDLKHKHHFNTMEYKGNR
jgi:hypothetical protein